MSCEKKKEMRDIINNVTGGIENYLRTSIILDKSEHFIDLKEMDRINYLSKLCNIYIFDNVYELVKNDMMEDKLKHSIFNKELKH